jgi:hypothetical protein
MSQTNDLLPPIDSSVEVLTIGFDFGRVLASGESIASIVELTCEVYLGADPSPASRLIGTPAIIASQQTKVAAAAVAQQVGSMLAGATYRLQCVVLTTQGNQPSLWTHFACVEPD